MEDIDTLTVITPDFSYESLKNHLGDDFPENGELGTFTLVNEEEIENEYVLYLTGEIPELILKGDVVVRYQDTKGNELDQITLNGLVGKDWASEQKDFEGYKFKEVIGAITGTYTEDAQTVTYVYDKGQEDLEVSEEPEVLEKPEVPKESEVKPEEKPKIPGTNIGTNAVLYASTLMTSLGGLYMLARKKRK